MWPFSRSEAQPEQRSLENPTVPVSSSNIIQFLGLDSIAESGIAVDIDAALGVPAIWAAVNFMSGTLAGLPLHVYKRTGDGRERVQGGVSELLHDAVNDEMSSFEWRKGFFDNVFTQGRGLSFIERTAGSGQILNLWPLDPAAVTVKRVDGRRFYDYREGRRVVRYEAGDVIDVPFMLRRDGLAHRSPILANKDMIGLAIGLERYASRLFQNGGIPPLVLKGPFQTQEAVQRATAQVVAALKKAAEEKRNVLVMPPEHELVPIGIDPQKGQMTESQRFMVEQVARIYSLPPNFLQDLTHATFSNVEQQDLHFVKHTIKRWVQQFEQELNLKLFGRADNAQFVEMNLDGILRGDFATRMAGHAQSVQTAIRTPNEVRALENLPALPHGDELLIQGATMPLGSQPVQAPTQPPQQESDEDGD